ncbi:phosphotriesterase-related protein [Paramicrobacterium humi]|uniref:Phosphotriesterase-related protein n=1 Tax=Paramicrobacterium humi TaxID=640635 RepID=A0A1H4LZ23_9MICO|nr:aryldialkylphosphatase [Microbacterium humi]SEB75817.1 phosphotriesterase-related protein [Microbacterium humi]
MSVRTVLGDVDPSALGTVNYHEHLFQVSPLLAGDEIDDESRSGEEATLLRGSGFAAMIDATPYGLGRQPAAVARISARAELTVVGSTGAHREAHYADDHWLRGTDAAARAALFTADIRDGMPAAETSLAEARGERAVGPSGEPVRAGLIKTGIDYWAITGFERTTLEAAAAAHAETGAPIMVHLEFCTAAHEVLDLLVGLGVAADRVVLAHADRDPDPELHAELAARGAYLGYDGIARAKVRSDAELVDLTAALVESGHSDRLLLGGDVARRSRYVAYGGMPGLGHLGARYVPRLRRQLGDAAVDGILVTNPARLLAV